MNLIIDALKKVHMKPSAQNMNYAKTIMQSHGGIEEFVKEYKKQKEFAPKAPTSPTTVALAAITTSDGTTPVRRLSPPKCAPPPRPPKILLNSTAETIVEEQSVNKEEEAPPVAKPEGMTTYNSVVMVTQSSNKLESTSLNTPCVESTISFLSPIPTSVSFETSASSQNDNSSLISSSCNMYCSPYKTPPTSFSSSLNDQSAAKAAAEATHDQSEVSSRSALLKSIENFKGGLKHLTVYFEEREREERQDYIYLRSL